MSNQAIDFDRSKSLPIRLRRGQSIDKTIQVRNSDGTNFDFTGYTADLLVYNSYNSDAEEFEIVVTLSSGALRLTHAEITRKRENFVYILWITDPTGYRQPWTNGDFFVGNQTHDQIDDGDETITISPDGDDVVLTISPLGGITSASIVSALGYTPLSGTLAQNKFLVGNSSGAATAFGTPFIMPEVYGAVGDGLTDDSTAIQNAITAAASQKAIVWLGLKTYKIVTSLTVPDNTRIAGCGSGSILYTTANISVLSLQGKGIQISDLTIQGNDTGASQIGINITGNAGLTLDYTNNKLINVDFKDLTTGLYVTLVLGSSGSVHEGALMAVNCKASSCGTGFYLDNRAEYCVLANCNAFSCTTGFRHNGGNNRWIGGQISDCTTAVLLGTGSNDGKSTMSGCSFNHVTTGVSSTGLTQGFLFTNNYFAVSSVSIGTSAGIKFFNNVFSTANITVTTCTFTEFKHNIFRTTPTISITGTNPTWFGNTFEAGTIPTQARDPYNWIISKRYISGRMYTNTVHAGVLTTQALAANILRAFPWRIQETLVVDLFEINVATGVGSTTCRFGIYTDDGTGYPGSLVTNSDAGTYDTSTSATFIQNTPAASITLTPGLYWIAYNSNGGPTLRAHAVVDNLIGAVAGTTGDGMAWSVSLAYGAMPSTFTAGGTVVTGQSISGCPRLLCRAV